jgi:hypothetical protein
VKLIDGWWFPENEAHLPAWMAEQTIRRCKPVVCVEQKREMARRFDLEPRGAVVYLQTLGYTVATELGGDYLMTAG